MNTYKTLLTTIIVSSIFLLGFTSVVQQTKPWNVPESAKKMKNPLKNDSENINLGKSLYAKHCRSCHGKNGEGDGTKAGELETFPGDFTTKEFQEQTDGAIFYKTSEGRDDMPSFSKKISNDEDVWAIVHYLRTLKAG
jgi:mono/diheme cytochrome c family protein